MESQSICPCHKKYLIGSFAGGLLTGVTLGRHFTNKMVDSRARSVLKIALPALLTFSFTCSYVGMFISRCDDECGKVSKIDQKKINEVETR